MIYLFTYFFIDTETEKKSFQAKCFKEEKWICIIFRKRC